MSARPQFWYEKPDKEGRNGRIVSVKGRDVPVQCPACGVMPVVYNGNYFCDGWGDTCSWALAHPARSRRDRYVCDLIGTDYS